MQSCEVKAIGRLCPCGGVMDAPSHSHTACVMLALREDLSEVVRQQEKLCVEAWSALGPSPPAAACSEPIQGRLTTPAQLVEAVEDVW